MAAPVQHVVAAPDKFKGTATATQIAAAIARAGAAAGIDVRSVPMSDGGDGMLDVLGGITHTTRVTGPDGTPVQAGWRLDGTSAVIESALASGLVLAGGAKGNDAVAATSRGTGELVQAAVDAGATSVLVGLGGSACTDGGLGALAALDAQTLHRIAVGAVQLTVCCDVETRYEDAAWVFAPQKGASPEQVALLSRRLATACRELRSRFGVDVSEIEGGGAAGGLAGGFAAAGGLLRSGFDLVADEVHLAAALRGAGLVLTGEGRLDDESFAGKVVGGVVRRARQLDVPVVAIVGERAIVAPAGVAVISLVERFGADRAHSDVLGCVGHIAAEVFASY